MAQEITQAIKDRMAQMAPMDWAKCQALADELGLKARSLQAACTRNNIPYAKQGRVSKTGDKVVSKTDLVAAISKSTEIPVEGLNSLEGLEKANKTALQALVDYFAELDS
jgi:hypothetical protein